MGMYEFLDNLKLFNDVFDNVMVYIVIMIEVINLVLYCVMIVDENVVVLGEDVVNNGGVFCVIIGFKDCFGCKWVMDMSLVEMLIVGISVGMVV